jgi:hypothetical protein
MASEHRQRRLSEDWADLADKDVAPLGEGRSAEIAARDEGRKHKRSAHEDRRVPRRFKITCATRNTPKQLLRICQQEGFTDEAGQGVISSNVVEALILAGVRAYEQGVLDLPRRKDLDKPERLIDVTCRTDETPSLLRAICGDLGYLNKREEPMINSRVVEELIQAGIDAYDQGDVQVVSHDDEPG